MSVDAAAVERLPWLAEEIRPKAAKLRRGRSRLLWSVAAVSAISLGVVWIGATSIGGRIASHAGQAGASITVRLPPIQAPTPKPQVAPRLTLAPAKKVRPAPPKEARAQIAAKESPRPVRAHVSDKPKHSIPQRHSAAKSTASAKSSSKSTAAGTAGRVIEIGAFGSAEQAKSAWSSTIAKHPALGGLPTKVTESRNSRRQTFYRMRVGTTSQAHSEVLCQRMRAIKLSCAIIGLPWKAKVER